MTGLSEQYLSEISNKINQMVDLLRSTNQQSGQTPTGPGLVEMTSGSSTEPPPFVKMMLDAQQQRESRTKKPRKVLEESSPVNITGFAPKSLKNLAGAIKGDDKSVDTKTTGKDSFIDGLLNSIGVPLLALAGGVTALLASTNINFGAFEGLANAIGKGGLQAGLKVFTKAFGKLAGPVLRRIPVIGALISFYYAKERYDKGDSIGMAIDLASGMANLLNLVMPGVGSMLSIGLDMLNAYLDFKTTGDEDPKAAKTDILKEMGKKIWTTIKPYVRFIPFVGSIWLAKDAHDAFKSGDYGNALTYVVRTIANFVPLAGTAVNVGLSVVQGMIDPSKREKNTITDGAMSLMERFGPMFMKYVEPFIRDIPFVGAFFHAHDMIESFKSGSWITGSVSLLQTLASFLPGVGMLLTPALSFFRGMIDPSYAKKSKVGSVGSSLMEMVIDWGQKLVAFVDPFIRDIPFIGGIFYFADAIKEFNKGNIGTGLLDLGQAFFSVFPGLGTIANVGINFLRGMVDPTRQNKSVVSSFGSSTSDWISQIAKQAKAGLSRVIWDLVDDYVPDVWGIKSGVVSMLEGLGISKPSDIKIEKPRRHTRRSGTTRKQFSDDHFAKQSDEQLKSFLDSQADLSKREWSMLYKEVANRKKIQAARAQAEADKNAALADQLLGEKQANKQMLDLRDQAEADKNAATVNQLLDEKQANKQMLDLRAQAEADKNTALADQLLSEKQANKQMLDMKEMAENNRNAAIKKSLSTQQQSINSLLDSPQPQVIKKPTQVYVGDTNTPLNLAAKGHVYQTPSQLMRQNHMSDNKMSNKELLQAMQENNRILSSLSQNIVKAVNESNTVVNNNSINSSNSVYNSSSSGGVRSFKEQVKNSLYK